MVIARDKMEGTLYSTDNASDYIVVATENGDADLWHSRLGHMSAKECYVRRVCYQVSSLLRLGYGGLHLREAKKKVNLSKGGRTLKKQRLELVHNSTSEISW